MGRHSRLKPAEVKRCSSFCTIKLPTTALDQVFVSYAHEDEAWKDRMVAGLCVHWKPSGALPRGTTASWYRVQRLQMGIFD